MADKINISNLTDQELLIKIRENSDYLGEVYKRCKPNCSSFIRKMTNGSISDGDFEDVYQDASIILYEKIINVNFVLTSSFQTYLNSVCRFQVLNSIKKSNLNTAYIEDSDDDDDENPMGYRSSITDSLDEIGNQKETQFLAIEIALEIMRNGKGDCYQILTQFWYHKKSMNDLVDMFGHKNDKSAKTQKHKCQEKLRKLAFNELNN
jgi:RNA polymerase sigma factor (sigma-70 family)